MIETILQGYREKLTEAPASLKNLPVTHDIDDLPAGALHQTFALTLVSGPFPTGKLYGGGVVEYQAEIGVEVHWDPELDSEAIHDTIGVDLENVCHVMLKSGNRPAGVSIVNPTRRFAEIEGGPNDVARLGTFTAEYRVTQDMT